MLVLSALGGCSGGGSALDQNFPVPTVASVPGPSGASSTTAPTRAALSAVSVSFPDPGVGWVYGTASCGLLRCVTLRRTTDGGAHWAAVDAPPFHVVGGTGGSPSGTIVFADADNGWAFTPPVDGRGELLATHDGGTSWTAQTLPPPLGATPGVEALAAGGGSVRAVVSDASSDDFAIVSSPVGSDSWNVSSVHLPLGAGPVPRFALVLTGAGALIADSDRGPVGGAALTGGTWQPWTQPCQPAGGYGDVQMAAAGPDHVVVFCPPSDYAQSPAAPALFESSDGGASFHLLHASPPARGPCLATPSAGAVVFEIVGASVGTITASFDEGRSWQDVAHFAVSAPGGDVTNPGALQFPSASRGYALTPAGAVLTSSDGGRTWTALDWGR